MPPSRYSPPGSLPDSPPDPHLPPPLWRNGRLLMGPDGPHAAISDRWVLVARRNSFPSPLWAALGWFLFGAATALAVLL